MCAVVPLVVVAVMCLPALCMNLRTSVPDSTMGSKQHCLSSLLLMLLTSLKHDIPVLLLCSFLLVIAALFVMSIFACCLAGVKAGGDRQELHEAIRVHSMEAGAVVKGEGKPNDLLERVAKNPLFKAVHSKLDQLVDPSLFVGRAPEQVTEFITEDIDPVLEANKDLLNVKSVDGVNV